jgi:hypothetical protein
LKYVTVGEVLAVYTVTVTNPEPAGRADAPKFVAP